MFLSFRKLINAEEDKLNSDRVKQATEKCKRICLSLHHSIEGLSEEEFITRYQHLFKIVSNPEVCGY
jgi:hypothetical protein